MWSASYDSEPSSLFAFQRELSTAIAEQIRLRRSLERLTALAGRQTQDFSAAAQFAQQAISIDPEFWVGYFQLAQAHEQLGNTDLAFDALNNAGRFSGGNSKPTALRGYLFAKLGKSKEAHDVLNTLEAVSRERYIPPYAAALVHAGLGQRDAACDWLERAYAARDVHLLLLPIDPKWDPFRTDPRFLAILTRCAFAKRAS